MLRKDLVCQKHNILTDSGLVCKLFNFGYYAFYLV